MIEREPSFVPNTEYTDLANSLFEYIKTDLKEGLVTKQGRFLPRKGDSPTFYVEFDERLQEARFNIGSFDAFIEHSMTYHIKKGQPVTKTGYVEGHSHRLWGIAHYTDATLIEMEEISGEPLEPDEIINPPQLVDTLQELEALEKIIKNPFENAKLVDNLPRFLLV